MPSEQPSAESPDADETPPKHLRYMLPPDLPEFHSRFPEIPSTSYGGMSFVTEGVPFARTSAEHAKTRVKTPQRPATDQEVRAFVETLRSEGVLD